MLFIDARGGGLDLGVEPSAGACLLLAPSGGTATLFGAESRSGSGRARQKRRCRRRG